jgi:hypothetical protein
MIIFVIWIILAFIVASFGKNTNLGYGGTLLISLIFSPVIGLIVAAVSGKPQPKKEEPYKIAMAEADKLEYKGRNAEAIDKYMDAMYHLENDYPNVKGKMEENRRILLERLSRKVESLSQRQTQVLDTQNQSS